MTKPQAEILHNYPLIKELARLDVPTFVRKYNIQYLHENFFRFVFLATCFAQPHQSNALFYLGTLFPLIIPTYVIDFTGAIETLTAKTKNRIRLEKIVRIERSNGKFLSVSSSGHEILSKTVVLALPYHNASKLWNVPEPHCSTTATVIYARGERTPKFRDKNFILCDPAYCGIGLVWSQDSGDDLIFALENDPDLTFLYSKHTITGQATWKTAVVLSDHNWSPIEIESGVYLVGDYNICGVEDSMITGICAANMIAKRNLE